MAIIVGRGRSKATQRIEINDPSVSREHCWLTDNGDGTYTLENKSQQGTFVNGHQVIKTRVTSDTLIQLSPTTIVKVAELIPLTNVQSSNLSTSNSTSQVKQQPVLEFTIRPLQYVWDEYHNKQLAIKTTQRTTNLMRSASPMFTLGSGTIATIARTMGWGNAIFGLTIVMTIIGLCLMVYSFVRGYNDKSIEELDTATEEFQHRYVCPNPKCNHFLGNQSYRLIRQNKNCPWCKCKYTES